MEYKDRVIADPQIKLGKPKKKAIEELKIQEILYFKSSLLFLLIRSELGIFKIGASLIIFSCNMIKN